MATAGLAVMCWFFKYRFPGNQLRLSVELRLQAAGHADIFNTDQGSQFTSHDFTSRLADHGVDISMDGRGRVMDNIFIERLWRTVKYEEIYLKDYVDVPEAMANLKIYFGFYNHERPHQALGYQTPAAIYFQARKKTR